jgi:hypothetical protein
MNRIDRLSEGLKELLPQQFIEALVLKNLERGGVSNLTARYLKQRLTDPEANRHVELIEAKWKIEDNEIVIFFYVSPTYGSQEVLTPTAKPYQGSYYNVVFQYVGVEQYLGTIDEYTADNMRKRTDKIRNMIWNCPLKVYSNDPSFYYQASWEDLAKVDGAVFPFPGPTGTGYWHQKHAQSGGLSNANVHITKHMANIIHNMTKLIPVIAKALKKIEGPEAAKQQPQQRPPVVQQPPQEPAPMEEPEIIGDWLVSGPGGPSNELYKNVARNKARYDYGKEFGIPYVNVAARKAR